MVSTDYMETSSNYPEQTLRHGGGLFYPQNFPTDVDKQVYQGRYVGEFKLRIGVDASLSELVADLRMGPQKMSTRSKSKCQCSMHGTNSGFQPLKRLDWHVVDRPP